MSKYVIIPKNYTSEPIEASSAEEAMAIFAARMEMDMNIYFKPEAIYPVRFTVEEYVEDWKTGKEKVVERHEVKAETYEEAFLKAYPYERGLRYCSGHYMRITEPEYMEKYSAWKHTGLTPSVYYGSSTVD